MSILEEFIDEIKDVLIKYQKSAGKLRDLRIRDIDDITKAVQKNNGCYELREFISHKIENTEVGSISLFAWYDLVNFRSKLKSVINQDRFLPKKLLLTENTELKEIARSLQFEISELKENNQTPTIDASFESLLKNFTDLKIQLGERDIEIDILKKENNSLMSKVSVLTTERDKYYVEMIKAQEQFQKLNTQYLLILQENKNLRKNIEQPIEKKPIPTTKKFSIFRLN